MIDAMMLIWGLIPVTIGFGFIFRPRKMAKAQARFRKRIENFEKKLFKAHRATGLAILLLGVMMVLTWFHPVWIYNLFVVARVLAGLFFPQLFQPSHVAQIIPTVWI
jgi:fatty acid desaturase